MKNDLCSHTLVNEKNNHNHLINNIYIKKQLNIFSRLLIRTQSMVCSIIADGKEVENTFKMNHDMVIEALLTVKIKLEALEKLANQLSREIKC